MELIVTIAYVFAIWLVFFRWRWLRFNVPWGLFFSGLWMCAALTEIIFLGQYTPYSKEMMVSTYVMQIAPEFGGIVTEVHIEGNTPVKKGDPLFQMDPKPWQDKVDALTPQVATARRNYEDTAALVKAQVDREVKLVQKLDELNALEAQLAEAQYNLDHALVVAPSDGYAENLQLRPGVFIRLKQPVVSFIDTEVMTILAVIPQVASQRVRAGDKAEVAFDMYPGQVFDAKVDQVIFGSGAAQFSPSGLLPALQTLHLPEQFVVKLSLTEEDPDRPLRFSASGIASIYTADTPDVLVFLRRLELQSESYLDYLYNPF